MRCAGVFKREGGGKRATYRWAYWQTLLGMRSEVFLTIRI